MVTYHPILPFPSDIDRAYFGAWLSGFTDGEGCFAASLRTQSNRNPTPGCRFSISQRDDDRHIIELIQSFLQVGKIDSHPVNKVNINRKPQARYFVDDLDSLVSVVIPNFEKYPLVAKKSCDFIIWSKLVLLSYAVNQRPRPRRRTDSRWAVEELGLAKYLVDALHEIRAYQTNCPTGNS